MNIASPNAGLQQSMGRSWRDALPSVEPKVLYPSLAIGFVLMLILSLKSLQQIQIARLRTPWLNFKTKCILDVSLLQFASLVILIYPAYKYFSRATTWSPRRVLASLIVFFICLFATEFFVEEVFLKPSFRYGTIQGPLQECAVTSFL